MANATIADTEQVRKHTTDDIFDINVRLGIPNLDFKAQKAAGTNNTCGSCGPTNNTC